MQAQALLETSQRFGAGLEASLQGAESLRSPDRVRPRPLDQLEAKREDIDKAMRVCSAFHRSLRATRDVGGIPTALHNVIF